MCVVAAGVSAARASMARTCATAQLTIHWGRFTVADTMHRHMDLNGSMDELRYQCQVAYAAGNPFVALRIRRAVGFRCAVGVYRVFAREASKPPPPAPNYRHRRAAAWHPRLGLCMRA